MKQVSAQEEQVLKMMKHSTSLFPDRKEYQKIDDAAIGWQNRKRKTNPRLQLNNQLNQNQGGMPVRHSVEGAGAGGNNTTAS